jgi:hypothetical protein
MLRPLARIDAIDPSSASRDSTGERCGHSFLCRIDLDGSFHQVMRWRSLVAIKRPGQGIAVASLSRFDNGFMQAAVAVGCPLLALNGPISPANEFLL